MSSNQDDVLMQKGIRKRLVSLWPGLPFFSLGLYLAWILLLSDTCAWVSDIDASGNALLNADLLIKLSGQQYIAAAVFLLLLTFAHDAARRFLASKAAPVAVAVLGVLATVCLIGSGPYFIGGPFGLDIKGLFSVGAVLCGLTQALLILMCAKVLGGAEPYKVLVYGLLSLLLVAAVYGLVMCNDLFRPYAGGPPASGIFALAVLPGAAAFVASLKEDTAPGVATNLAEKVASSVKLPASSADSHEKTSVFANVRRVFGGKPDSQGACNNWGSLVLFVLTLFLFALAVSVSLGNCATNLNVATLQMGMRASVDARLLVALVLLLLLVGWLDRLPLASICVVVAAVISAALSLCPLIGLDSTVTYVIVYTASGVFEIMLWCMLSIIALRGEYRRVNVFGLGFFAVMLGSGIGWIFTSDLLPVLSAAQADVPVYVALALATLSIAAYVFGGKHFGILFSANAEHELSLNQGKGLKMLVNRQTDGKRVRPWKDACQAICQEAGLSEREREIFTLLSMGHTADAVAEELFISANTVRTHIHNIYGKLDIHSKQELINLVRARTKEL